MKKALFMQQTGCFVIASLALGVFLQLGNTKLQHSSAKVSQYFVILFSLKITLPADGAMCPVLAALAGSVYVPSF